LAKIHPSSVVDSSAEIHESVEIGPFCYVESGVVLGEGCKLDSHVTVKRHTTLGSRNYVGQGAIIGGDPQDRKYKGEPTYLNIGDDNMFREYVTIHRATGEGNSTVVGNRCFLMAFCHLGHNCVLHDDVTMANNVGCSGHVTVERLVTIGGMTGVHQFVRIGQVAMVGGMSRIVRDVPPYVIVKGEDEVQDINAVGLRRIGITSESRMALHKAVKLMFKSQLGLSHAIETVRREVRSTDEVEVMIQFMERLFKGKNGRGDQP
jgi:UDP-N-acetylglucosamine acyltransferase